MKAGIVSAEEVLRSPGINMTAEYYLDRCVHCGHQEDDTHHHQSGQCGSYKRVFVPKGTTFTCAGSTERKSDHQPEEQ